MSRIDRIRQGRARDSVRRQIFWCVLILTWLAANLLWGETWQFTATGNLGGDDGFGKTSQALGVSGDGQFVVGDSLATAGLGITTGTEAFLWSVGKPLMRIGTLAKQTAYSSAKAVSFEGRVVVGESQTSEGKRGFRWDQAKGIVSLGTLPGHDESVAWSVSGDGTIIVGESSSIDQELAFRWTRDKMVSLDDLPGGERESVAMAISRDGTTIVGHSRSQHGMEACRWQAQQVLGLGSLAGKRFASRAFAVSADGNVVVGDSLSPRGPEAFRWTKQAGMQALGDLPEGDFRSKATGVSADGNTIVGAGTGERGSEAFIWNPQAGMQSLGYLLQQQGLAANWQLQQASGVSHDGKVIVGIGLNPAGETAGWVARR